MGVGKTVATVGGGIAAGKVINEVLDNEGDEKSVGKTVAAVGGGVVAAKLISGAMDETKEKKKEDKEAESKDDDKGDTLTKVASVVAAGSAVKAAMDTSDMKKMMKENQTPAQNPFAKGVSAPQGQLEGQTNSFQAAVSAQQNNIQKNVDAKGLNNNGLETEQEYNV